MNRLASLAYLGTVQSNLTESLGSSEVDELVSSASLEEKVLLLAGARGLYDQAGRLPVEDLPVPAAADADGKAVGSTKLINLLQQVLENRRYDLLLEYANLLKKKQRYLPYEILPQILDISDAGYRQQLIPVLGPRGMWLSQFHPRWSWVSQGIASITEQDRTALKRAWEEGQLNQRKLALNVIRQTDVEEGRRWLEESLPREKANTRAILLESLQTGLSSTDEPFLEKMLDDRSEQVRQQAAELLMHLPDSALALRMKLRASAMVHGTLPTLQLVPPEELPLDWIRDGISPKTPAGRSKRGSWLEAVIRAVPVSTWTDRYGAEPAQFLQAVRHDPFCADLVRGLTRSIQLREEATAAELIWVDALWNYWLLEWQSSKKTEQTTLSCMVALLKRMPASTAEHHLLPFLVPGRMPADALLMLLENLPRPWSETFSRHYLQIARQIVKTAVLDQAYEWAKSMEQASRSVPEGLLDAALSPWELREPTSWTGHALVQQVERFLEQVQLRRMFYKELDSDQPQISQNVLQDER
jgi:hypothetical protein